MQGGKVDHLINVEIVLLLSDGHLVSDPLNMGSRPPPAQSEGHTYPERGEKEEQVHHSPITGQDESYSQP